VTQRIVRCHVALAAGLAGLIALAGLTWNTRVAAGADAYGYVSQADLWLRGDLHIDQSFGATVPWPMARWTFTPLGYRPEPDGYRIVPAYPPGLPLLMAAAKAIAGHCALFWVVPLSGAVLVLATYFIGRRIGRPLVGLAAAWVVATSPTLLFMLMAPMSDVPAAAAWAVAVACVLGATPAAALGGGVAAAIAILVRPNLVPIAAVLFVWIWSRHHRRAALMFLIPAMGGAAVVALINARLYGSPLRSGHDLTDGYALAYIWPNLQRYVGWFLSAENPFAIAGLVALILPAAALWPARARRDARWLLAACAAVVWISYLFYVPWDAWWYLRFLLPSWPMMAIGIASLAAAIAHASGQRWRPVVLAGLAVVGVAGVVQAGRRAAFDVARGEAKYVEVARAVESITGPDDVIISAQHSGSIRYYAGRLTLRWDVGDPAWLDRTVDWLASHGHHPYFVVEEAEIATLREKYGAANASARLDWTPMVSFRDGAVTMFDAINREPGAAAVLQTPIGAVHDCPPPRPAPALR
jgi:hypothetical protein